MNMMNNNDKIMNKQPEKARKYPLSFILSTKEYYLNVHPEIINFKHKDTSYKPKSAKGILSRKLADHDEKFENDDDAFENELNISLNKMVKENYEEIVYAVKAMKFNNENKIKILASTIIKKSLAEPNFLDIYMLCCKEFVTIKHGEITFFKILINNIREIFLDSIKINPDIAKEMEETREDLDKPKRIAVCKIISELSLLLPMDEIIFKCINIMLRVIETCHDEKLIFTRDVVTECLINIITIIVQRKNIHESIKEQLKNSIELIRSHKSIRLNVKLDLAIKDVDLC
jgi:hypothetical protein